MTPDNMPILGEATSVEGLYLACGFSGHGFMHSPAVGRIIAELILEGKTTLPDFQQFGMDRFQQQVEQRKGPSFI